MKGCDGTRMYFDGASLISMNGHIVAQLPQFSVPEVEVVLGAVDLDLVRSVRQSNSSRGVQSTKQRRF